MDAKKILNIGSGSRTMPCKEMTRVLNEQFNTTFEKGTKYTNIDKYDGGNNDILNLDNPNLLLPYKDNTFDALVMNQVFEHIENVIPLMNEAYRVAKPGAMFYITCPYETSKWAWGDIDHKRVVNEHTFLWFDQAHYERNKQQRTSCTPNGVKCNWEYTGPTRMDDEEIAICLKCIKD
jgi:SAM-dependent methyltransferase